ncbi:hypothetical protein ACSSS7_001419 [Eimeria intestinalis]
MVTRFPWQCADCKICESCFSNENEERMLICDACDRAFHMECLDPPVDEVPDGDWFCKGCGYCSCCGRQLTEEEALVSLGVLGTRVVSTPTGIVYVRVVACDICG